MTAWRERTEGAVEDDGDELPVEAEWEAEPEPSPRRAVPELHQAMLALDQTVALALASACKLAQVVALATHCVHPRGLQRGWSLRVLSTVNRRAQNHGRSSLSQATGTRKPVRG